MTYEEAAERVEKGYEVESGYEKLWKNGNNAWMYEDEDGKRIFLTDAEAAQVLEAVFPGSPAGMVEA
jgi:hypothetical protein